MQGLLLAARTHATIEGTIDRDGNDPGKTTKIELQDIADVHRKIAAEVSPDGSFYFPNVASGSYMINGIDLENGYVKMVSVNGREVRDSTGYGSARAKPSFSKSEAWAERCSNRRSRNGFQAKCVGNQRHGKEMRLPGLYIPRLQIA